MINLMPKQFCIEPSKNSTSSTVASNSLVPRCGNSHLRTEIPESLKHHSFKLSLKIKIEPDFNDFSWLY